MSIKIKSGFADKTVHFRRGTKMVKIKPLSEATKEQLEQLLKIGYPGVIKEKPAAKANKGSSS